MKKSLILLTIPLLAGCISWNNQATLTTKYANTTKSVQDLNQSFESDKSLKFHDKEAGTVVDFHYQDEPTIENLQKAIVTYQPNFAEKEITHIFFEKGKPVKAKLETHSMESNETKLHNHTFNFEDSQIKSVYFQNSLIQTESANSEEIAALTQKVEATLAYVTSAFLSES